ncbi:hypothetical protein DICVIV_07581 [Dictyocaulus viviparus]|uniref:Uncharacterized protein n=1 Tax=Dictyocaulus viviparus TaxID=29172 RepID=A0A0D8XVJ2_DICVI|nr:hypothetical protein DICVIV_07581 [Dictyocaulus viviparus]
MEEFDPKIEKKEASNLWNHLINVNNSYMQMNEIKINPSLSKEIWFQLNHKSHFRFYTDACDILVSRYYGVLCRIASKLSLLSFYADHAHFSAKQHRD